MLLHDATPIVKNINKLHDAEFSSDLSGAGRAQVLPKPSNVMLPQLEGDKMDSIAYDKSKMSDALMMKELKMSDVI